MTTHRICPIFGDIAGGPYYADVEALRFSYKLVMNKECEDHCPEKNGGGGTWVCCLPKGHNGPHVSCLGWKSCWRISDKECGPTCPLDIELLKTYYPTPIEVPFWRDGDVG